MPLKFQVLLLLFAAASSMENVDFGLGDELYSQVVKLKPRHAEKITGILIHVLKDTEISELLTNQSALSKQVNEAYRLFFEFLLDKETTAPLEDENEQLRKELFKMHGPLFKQYEYSEEEFDVLVDKITLGTPRRNDVKEIMIEVLEFKFGKIDVQEKMRSLLMNEGEKVLKTENNDDEINRDGKVWSMENVRSRQKSAIFSKEDYREIMEILKDVGSEGNYTSVEIIEALEACGNDVEKALVALRSKNMKFADDDLNLTAEMTPYNKEKAWVDWGDSIYQCPRVKEQTDPSFRCTCELCQEYGKRKRAPWEKSKSVNYWKEYRQIEQEEKLQIEQENRQMHEENLQIEQEENRQMHEENIQVEQEEILQTRTYPFAVVVSYLEDYDRLALALCSEVLMRQVMRTIWGTTNLKGERRFFAHKFVLALEKAVEAVSKLSKPDLQLASRSKSRSKSESRVSKWPPAKMVYLSKEYQIAYLIKDDVICVVLKGENRYKNMMLKMRNEEKFASRRVFRRDGNSAVFFFPEAAFNEIEIEKSMMLYIFDWKEEEREMHCHWWELEYTEDEWQVQEWLTSPQCDCPEKWLQVGNELRCLNHELNVIRVVKNLKK